MKIIRLHVDHFGTLENVDMDFTDGMNTVLKDNGWGKSTLTAFLRVMFFGFDNGGKKAVRDREKYKFTPWNGGTFGGEIRFETDGKEYILSRTFTGNTDTFSLKDAVTLLDSPDYSEKIGEEIFGVDSESFKKTSFISRNNLAYRGTNSTINSKVGNVTDLDDLGNYDLAEQKLKDYANKYSPDRKPGILKMNNLRIKDLTNEVHKKDALLKTADEKRKEIEKANEETEELKILQKELAGKQKEILGRQSKAGDLKHYTELASESLKRENIVKEKCAALGEVPPTTESLEKLGRENEEALKLYTALPDNENTAGEERFLRLKRYFKENPPSEEEIGLKLEACEKLKSIEAQRAKADEDEEAARKAIRSINDSIDNKEKEISLKKRDLSAFEETGKKDYDKSDKEEELRSGSGKKLSKVFTVFAAICIVAGIVLALLFLLLHLANPFLIGAGALLLLGLVLLILSMAEHSKEKQLKLLEEERRKLREEQRKQIQIHEKMRKQSLNALESLNTEIESLKRQKDEFGAKITLYGEEKETLSGKKKETEAELKVFFEKYDLFYGSDASSVLHEMKGFLREYKELSKEKAESEEKKERNLNGYREKCESLRKSAKELGISGIDSESGEISHEELRRKITLLTDAIQEWENAGAEFAAAENKRKAFLEEHEEIREEAEKLSGTDAGESMNASVDFEAEAERLSNEIHRLSDEIPERIRKNRSLENELDEILDEIRELEEKEEEIDELTEEQNTLEKQYELMKLTGAYLKDAKEHFIANFTQPLKDAFDKYYELMVGTTEFQNSDFRIDANLDVTRKEDGVYHDIDTQSDGYSDMIGMCIRLALLDVMYSGEKPLVIMDDPFVNLDKNHLEGAKAFLDRVATEYQILYFTCHESRI